MTVTVQALISKQLEAVQTTQYTSTNARTIIDKFTITNTDTVNRTVSINLVTSGGVAGAANLIVDTKTIVPDETYLCPELIGQVLNPGDFISTIASSAAVLTARCSGRIVT
jgi:hypothetical protein